MIPSIQTQTRRDAIIRRAPNLPFTEILSAPLTLLSLSYITVNHRLILNSLSYPNHSTFNFCTPTMRVSLSFSSSLLLLTFTFQLFILAQSPPLLLFVLYFCIMICRSISSYQKGVKCLAGRSPNVSLLEPPLSPPACCLACHLTWNTTRASGIKESVSSLANNPFFNSS